VLLEEHFCCSPQAAGKVHCSWVRRGVLDVSDRQGTILSGVVDRRRLGSQLGVQIDSLEMHLKKFLHCSNFLSMPSIDDKDHLVRSGVNLWVSSWTDVEAVNILCLIFKPGVAVITFKQVNFQASCSPCVVVIWLAMGLST
jgi:hypothetical protein